MEWKRYKKNKFWPYYVENLPHISAFPQQRAFPFSSLLSRIFFFSHHLDQLFSHGTFLPLHYSVLVQMVDERRNVDLTGTWIQGPSPPLPSQCLQAVQQNDQNEKFRTVINKKSRQTSIRRRIESEGDRCVEGNALINVSPASRSQIQVLHNHFQNESCMILWSRIESLIIENSILWLCVDALNLPIRGGNISKWWWALWKSRGVNSARGCSTSVRRCVVATIHYIRQDRFIDSARRRVDGEGGGRSRSDRRSSDSTLT